MGTFQGRMQLQTSKANEPREEDGRETSTIYVI